MLYGDDFGGVYIDGALVHKTHHDIFCFIPVSRSMDQMDAWLWEAREEIRRIEEDRKRLGVIYDTTDKVIACDPGVYDLSYLPAAPKNTGSCYNYNSPCSYMDLCKSWGNPLQGIVETGTPAGYISSPWSPFTDEQRAEVARLIKVYQDAA
jgi:hypothetical protein